MSKFIRRLFNGFRYVAMDYGNGKTFIEKN